MNSKFLSAALVAALWASPAAAYIGPGAGLGAFGTVIAVIGALVLMIVGFVWYPVKRMLRRSKPADTATEAGVDPQ